MVGPNVKDIILETRLEESSIIDLGKAERDAQVRGFGLNLILPGLIDASLHGNTLILRSHCLTIILPAL